MGKESITGQRKSKCEGPKADCAEQQKADMATAEGPVAARYLHQELERLCKERLRPLQRSASGPLQEGAVPWAGLEPVVVDTNLCAWT